MSDFYSRMKNRLSAKPVRWGISGVAGFIGSHLLENLLLLDQEVFGVDNFFTGSQKNLDDVRSRVSPQQWARFRFFTGDIRDEVVLQEFCAGRDVVLHEAALGSVPRSIDDPVLTNEINVGGFVKMLSACRQAKVKRFVFASSSAIYGDDASEKKLEERIGQCLSPYAVSKYVNEVYARNFSYVYGIECIGLRYFNVFGPRQDPEGAYAAVIPKWIDAMLENKPVVIFGDGQTSRDFCYVENVVQANLLAATTSEPAAINQIYNVALSEKTSLKQLYDLLKQRLVEMRPSCDPAQPVLKPFRQGDILHSCAMIDKASERLGYVPEYNVKRGVELTFDWYASQEK